ncbi:hypothetical protein [Brevibacterium album]|uniref:hypothetical protein n=1 Tax=Brevibacterium album TaxID=417948 RepID=UPI0004166602|nr:hypothetical protein [Brevibacterium album]
MTRLTREEKTTVFLALEEYASGFALTLSPEDCDQTRALAKRILEARALQLEE